MSDPVAVSRISAVATILRGITELTGLRLSLIAHITETTWTCCAVHDQLGVGLEVGGKIDVTAFASYLAAPILLRNGEYFGNLCALDTSAIELPETTVALLQLFAELVGLQLDAEDQPQFLAELGHDLRTPLSAIVIGAESLESMVATAHERTIVQRIRRSADRISRLVNDVLDR